MSFDEPDAQTMGSPNTPSWWIPLVMLGLVGAGGLTYVLLRQRASPPPAAIANDPLLVRGREIYLSRCVSCHGASGRGDGPIARGLSGPPPGDLTDAKWKHGEEPEKVLLVVAQGVKDTSMPGWRGTLGADDLKAVSAYVYYLAGRPVPEPLRAP